MQFSRKKMKFEKKIQSKPLFMIYVVLNFSQTGLNHPEFWGPPLKCIAMPAKALATNSPDRFIPAVDYHRT